MNDEITTDEVVGRMLLWSDLRYVTNEEFELLVTSYDRLRAEVAELKARVAALEIRVAY